MSEREKKIGDLALRLGQMRPDARELLVFNLTTLSAASASTRKTHRRRTDAKQASARGRGRMRNAIQAVLAAADEPLSGALIAERVGRHGYDPRGADQNALERRVYAALHTMGKAGLVKSMGHGKGYVLAVE